MAVYWQEDTTDALDTAIASAAARAHGILLKVVDANRRATYRSAEDSATLGAQLDAVGWGCISAIYEVVATSELPRQRITDPAYGHTVGTDTGDGFRILWRANISRLKRYFGASQGRCPLHTQTHRRTRVPVSSAISIHAVAEVTWALGGARPGPPLRAISACLNTPEAVLPLAVFHEQDATWYARTWKLVAATGLLFRRSDVGTPWALVDIMPQATHAAIQNYVTMD